GSRSSLPESEDPAGGIQQVAYQEAAPGRSKEGPPFAGAAGFNAQGLKPDASAKEGPPSPPAASVPPVPVPLPLPTPVSPDVSLSEIAPAPAAPGPPPVPLPGAPPEPVPPQAATPGPPRQFSAVPRQGGTFEAQII